MKNNLNKDGYILHLDGDAFFAACETAQHPELKGKPIVVGRERGIATAFSYEAKALGVTRGMPIYKIKRDFPSVIILQTHFELYKMYNKKMLDVIRQYLDKVEDYSIDECFAEIPTTYSWQEACDLAREIKIKLQKETGLTFSFGLSSTKVLAKVASKHNKPDGITFIDNSNIDVILTLTKIGKIWGIGNKTTIKLTSCGINTAQEFKNLNREYIENNYDKPLQELWNELNGVKMFQISTTHDTPKSIQATRTFANNTCEIKKIMSEFSRNLEIATSRARGHDLYSNTLLFFLKDNNFKYYAREVKLDIYSNNPSDFLNIIETEIKHIFKYYINYRASGVTLANLRHKEDYTSDLFSKQEGVFGKKGVLDAVDHIKSKLGNETILLTSSLSSQKQRLTDKNDTSDKYIYDLPYPYLGEVL